MSDVKRAQNDQHERVMQCDVCSNRQLASTGICGHGSNPEDCV